MTLWRTTKTSACALRRNVTRSALTILGIVIGISAVIIMMEIGKGSSARSARPLKAWAPTTSSSCPARPRAAA